MRPISLEGSAADVNFKKFAKNFKSKISKICCTVFLYWHIDHVANFRKNLTKTVGVVILKKFDDRQTHRQYIFAYNGLLWGDTSPCLTFLESSRPVDVKSYLTCNAATYRFQDNCS